MKPKHIIAIVVAICVVLAGAIVYGVLTHKEAGLLQGCRTSDGSLDFPEKSCFAVKWAPGTKTLVVGDLYAEPWQHKALSSSIKKINKELGWSMLSYTDTTQPDILVSFNRQVTDPNIAARTIHSLREDGIVMKVYIASFDTVTDRAVMELVLGHEILHGIGLAHDQEDDSIMHLPPSSFSITNHDRKLLRGLYGK